MKTSNHIIMKKIILLLLLIICFGFNMIKAQTYKLDFEPKGKIVKFFNDSITFYTDATSIIDFYSDKDKIGNPFYAKRIVNYIKKRVKETNGDTIIVNGDKIDFKDEYNYESMNEWTIMFSLTDLLKR